MKTTGRFLMVIAGLVLALGEAQAQVPPLHIGTTNGIVDEFGVPLKGTTPPVVDHGYSFATGEVVQILYATNGIFPTDPSGNPDPRNPVAYEVRVGDGMDPSLGPVAEFGVALRDRVGVDDAFDPSRQVFARVFNKSSLPDSSFYGDSQIFTVGYTFNEPFIPQLQRTDKPTDTNDFDGDGLINSWEKSLHGDPNNPDTDGDGMADGPEFRSGTELTNDLSLLQMVELIPKPPQNIDVVWDTVDGKQYQVQFKAGDLADTNDFFNDVNAVIGATSLVSRTTITNALANPGGHYRVKLIELP